MNRLITTLESALGAHRVCATEPRLSAWSTDASYFAITPQAVVTVDAVEQLQTVLKIAAQFTVSVTFRAAGTSLSGQAVGEGILVRLGFTGFRELTIADDGEVIKLGAAVRGAEANAALAKFNRKIGPDPATLKVAMMGGIVANNSSGMCCGVNGNSYHTLRSLKMVLADGTVVDTSSAKSVASFRHSHHSLLAELEALALATQGNESLSKLIKRKYAIKNTTGFSINSLVDFSDGVDILSHLVVGSEGTLAFIDQVELETVSAPPSRATALLAFRDIHKACEAIPVIGAMNVSAAELLDSSAIETMRNKPGVPKWLNTLNEGAAVLLVEVAADNFERTQALAETVVAANFAGLSREVEFEFDEAACQALWNVRTGIFPVVGAQRPAGTTVIIEDVAVATRYLAEMVVELRLQLDKYNFSENAVIFGHALDGNLHFIVTPNLNDDDELARFESLMAELSENIVMRFEGSLKAEHGTGRAMAPFVEKEWGHEAYQLMKRIKALLDPQSRLNPGVIINADESVHMKQTKRMPLVDPVIDQCIECGFCEPACPSSDLSLSPRQRIATLRRGQRIPISQLRYDIDQSCAQCGQCASVCPVGIDTGQAVANFSSTKLDSSFARQRRVWQANHWGLVLSCYRAGFTLFHQLIGRWPDSWRRGYAQLVRKFNVPLPRYLPQAAISPQRKQLVQRAKGERLIPLGEEAETVFLLASCSARIFGGDQGSTDEQLQVVLAHAGFKLETLTGDGGLCCGQQWSNRGERSVASQKQQGLQRVLSEVPQKAVILTDAQSCFNSMNTAGRPFTNLLTFLDSSVVPKLKLKRSSEAIAVHFGCELTDVDYQRLVSLAGHCSTDVRTFPQTCCGGGGAKQFLNDELAQHAGGKIAKQWGACERGVYLNGACEVALSQHTQRPVHHIIELLFNQLQETAR
ncbi:FAD-binding and (Fe-S)-binding domain-containing protein [Umboniibacter marinipuniceus]|uniref:D-lactate dehydrogenase (cytochrome) n=1 Tax=Umboniibacter marinipuniceus TaxID=569599 RepID=A0A3M0AC35_9GAMM|nr:FAD-binding and (Fe-S)-binding domain-containing protein [Umboniibacter marinipuniceus]RMA79995.1 D-lactate dehydrogenase [Umboniibacter marinipuniceus]